jgi:hypothetical protein
MDDAYVALWTAVPLFPFSWLLAAQNELWSCDREAASAHQMMLSIVLLLE